MLLETPLGLSSYTNEAGTYISDAIESPYLLNISKYGEERPQLQENQLCITKITNCEPYRSSREKRFCYAQELDDEVITIIVTSNNLSNTTISGESESAPINGVFHENPRIDILSNDGYYMRIEKGFSNSDEGELYLIKLGYWPEYITWENAYPPKRNQSYITASFELPPSISLLRLFKSSSSEEFKVESVNCEYFGNTCFRAPLDLKLVGETLQITINEAVNSDTLTFIPTGIADQVYLNLLAYAENYSIRIDEHLRGIDRTKLTARDPDILSRARAYSISLIKQIYGFPAQLNLPINLQANANGAIPIQNFIDIFSAYVRQFRESRPTII